MSKLLDLLKDGRFHSGEALGKALGISRSAIWKQLQLLEADLGLVVHKVRGQGYRLEAPVSLLDADSLRASTERLGWDLELHEVLDSTNAQALRKVTQGISRPLLVSAERQDAGRGRRGRTWASPYAANLYYSLVLPIQGGIKIYEGLSLVAAMAVVDALRAHGIKDAGVKWPNDVLVNGRKIAGILLELVGDPSDHCHVVLGIGINVNMRTSETIDQQWTSLYLETQRQADRSSLAGHLSDSLAGYVARLERCGFAGLRDEWESLHLWQNRYVKLISAHHTIMGTVLGVTDQGALRLSIEGQEQVFSGGELSLRLNHDT